MYKPGVYRMKKSFFLLMICSHTSMCIASQQYVQFQYPIQSFSFQNSQVMYQPQTVMSYHPYHSGIYSTELIWNTQMLYQQSSIGTSCGNTSEKKANFEQEKSSPLTSPTDIPDKKNKIDTKVERTSSEKETMEIPKKNRKIFLGNTDFKGNKESDKIFDKKEKVFTIDASELLKGQDPIGQGGFGIVYPGAWGDKKVAIKELYLRNFSSQEKNDFDNETNILWKYQSQCDRLINLYGVCENPRSMVFEYMPTCLYKCLHEKQEKLNVKQFWQIAKDIVEGLAFLHKNKIYHLDIKSPNILLDKDYRAKLGDFGLAKLRSNTGSIVLDEYEQKKRRFSIRWTAPERLNEANKELTAATDMYSYGVVLWELLTQKLPYNHESQELIVMFQISQYKTLTIPETCDSFLRNIITSCWNSDLKSRPNAEEILDLIKKEQGESHSLL